MNTITDCWIDFSGKILYTAELNVILYYNYRGRSQIGFRAAFLHNDSRLLALSVVTGQCPIGVLLDRLEEHPDDAADMPTDLVRQCAQYLREQFPNGTCPHTD